MIPPWLGKLPLKGAGRSERPAKPGAVVRADVSLSQEAERPTAVDIGLADHFDSDRVADVSGLASVLAGVAVTAPAEPDTVARLDDLPDTARLPEGGEAAHDLLAEHRSAVAAVAVDRAIDRNVDRHVDPEGVALQLGVRAALDRPQQVLVFAHDTVNGVSLPQRSDL